ncbi:MAG TPA: hypothetical protein VHS06_03825 [Chloroflexota bacterium]|nr:hypothetical protein [Chloroflexota bacterium]
MRFFGEAWKLLKRSWRRIVKFALFMMMIRVLVLGLEFGIGLVFRYFSKRWCSPTAFVLGFTSFYWLVGLLGVLPAEKYMWFSVVSSAYRTEEPKLWQLYFQSFRSWTRMIMGGLWWGVFASPLMVVGALLFLPGLPGGGGHWREHLASFAWRSMPLIPFLGALSVYGSFAVLGIICEGRPALVSWRRAFSLIPRRELLATVGLLSALYSSVVLFGLLLWQILRVPAGLSEWVTFAMLAGLSISHFTLWHAHTRAEGAQN